MVRGWRWRLHGALLGVQLLFASWPVVGKLALASIPGPALIGLRSWLAALLFAVLGQHRRLAARQQAMAALAGFLGISTNQLLYIGGLQRTTVVNSTVLATTIPVFTLLLALLTRTERATKARVAGIAVAFAGALWVTGAGRLHLGPDALVGNVMLLGSTLAYSCYLLVAGRLSRDLDPMAVVPWVFLWGAVFASPVSVPALLEADIAWTPLLVGLVAYMVAGPTVGTYWLNAVALREAPPSLVAVFIYLQPVIAALLAYVALGEVPEAAILVGGGVIFAGVWVANRGPGRAQV